MTASTVEGTCVARMETTSKKYVPFGVTGKDQGIVVIGHLGNKRTSGGGDVGGGCWHGWLIKHFKW